MWCSTVASSGIFLATPSQRGRMPHLRIVLPELQEALRKNPVPRRHEGRFSVRTAAARKSSSAGRLQRDHVEEKRLKPGVPVVRVCPSTNSLSAPFRSTAAPYEHDVIIDRGEIRRRKKKPSRKFRGPVRPHAALARRGNPLAMPPNCHRQWCIWPIARHAERTAGSRASKNQISCSAHHLRNSRC
jgi:hypothetical protein